MPRLDARLRTPRPHCGMAALDARRLGRAMREQRELACVSLFDVARRIDVHADTIAAWEAGRSWPSLPALAMYARACGVSLREVLPT